MSLLRDVRGFGLIQTMIGVAIMGISLAVFTGVMTGNQRLTKGLSQKLEVLQIQQNLITNYADTALCGCNFDPTKNFKSQTFDSNNLAGSMVKVGELYSSCLNNIPGNPLVSVGKSVPGALTELTVGDVSLKNLQATGSPGGYRGELTINFDSDNLIIARRPAVVPINMVADVSNPSQARITSCSTTGAGGGGLAAPISCVMKSFPANQTGTYSCGTGESPAMCFAFNETSLVESVASLTGGGSGQSVNVLGIVKVNNGGGSGSNGGGSSSSSSFAMVPGTIVGNQCTAMLGGTAVAGTVYLSCCK